MEFEEFDGLDELAELDNIDTYEEDINSILASIEPTNYVEQLIALVGLYEEEEENDLINKYGITMDEYISPNADTIQKVLMAMNNKTI